MPPNQILQAMFLMIGGGERAGSGIDKIRQGWRSQHWRSPSIQETLQPDRVRLLLPMVSLLPEDSVRRLRQRFGRRIDRLNPLELQALVTAEIEGAVSNGRMREMCDEHPTEITRLLQGLLNRRCLEQVGQKRGAYYRLAGVREQKVSGSSQKPGSLSHKGESSHNGDEDSSHKLENLSSKELAAIKTIAAPALQSQRLAPEAPRTIILKLCEDRYFTAATLADLMNRNPRGLRDRFFRPMAEEGLLRRRFPDEPNHPNQAYTTNK